jgi:sortase (surface protein transpeptidase)
MRRSRLLLTLDLLMVGLMIVGLAALAFRPESATGPAAHASGVIHELPSPLSEATHSTAAITPTAKARAPRGAPARVAIPAIGVDAAIVRLGVNPDGTLEVPASFGVAGWYKLGVRPGEPGPAVIVGHVDSTSGPAVFYRLGRLAPGVHVRVSWRRGSSVRFSVYAVREYAKSVFPTALVYGPTQRPELRLVTCGGPFDEQTGHYLDNVVVFARMVS